MRLLDAAYYEARSVTHSAQGDLHDNVPFVRVVVAAAADDPRGQRKRPDVQGRFVTEGPVFHVGVLCHYTCGFLAQPPGTPGYSHQDRLMAPVLHMRDLRQRIGWSATVLHDITKRGRTHGVLYLPWPKVDDHDDEWRGHAAALLYRPSAVTQSVLDDPACPRIARLSEQAQHLLALGLIQVTSPNTFRPEDEGVRRPDMTDSWT